MRAAIRFDDLQWEHSYNPIAAYGQSKLANLMFTYELQRRLQGTNIIAAAAHPGGSNTELARNVPRRRRVVMAALAPLTQSAAMGALPTLRAATDPGVIGGQYFGPEGFLEQRGYPKVVHVQRAVLRRRHPEAAVDGVRGAHKGRLSRWLNVAVLRRDVTRCAALPAAAIHQGRSGGQRLASVGRRSAGL